jgi:hypothetical protein
MLKSNKFSIFSKKLGDQMRLWKSRPKCTYVAQSIFCENQYTNFTAEKAAQLFVLFLYFYKKPK